MSVLEVFCDVDDFMLKFAPQWKASQMAAGKQRERTGQLCASEVMTILIHFHQSHYRTFKAYYTEHVQVHLTQDFPHLVSYTRFVALIPADDASPAGLLAEPLWSLHRDQFHRFHLAFRL